MIEKEKNINPALLDLEKIFKEKAPKIYNKTPRFILNYLNRKIHVAELNEILTIYKDQYGVDFMKSVVEYFNLNLKIEGIDQLSKKNRYLFASNHPLGGLDGICLSAIIGEKFDKKIKYLVNDLLYFIKNLQPIFIPINKHGHQPKQNIKMLNDAFSSDNQIITFPAGMCSRKIKQKIIDLQWRKSFIQKAIESKRDIVPIYFEAKNSNFFYRFANLRKALGLKFNLEMVLLPDEMFKNRYQTFRVKFGEPISWTKFNSSESLQYWADYVRDKCYNLSSK